MRPEKKIVVLGVMLGEIPANEHFGRLKAAAMVRDEICGPMPKARQLHGADNRPSIRFEIITSKPEENEPRPQSPESVDPFELPEDKP